MTRVAMESAGTQAGRKHCTDDPLEVTDADLEEFTELIAGGLLTPVFDHQTAVQCNEALSFENAVKIVAASSLQR